MTTDDTAPVVIHWRPGCGFCSALLQGVEETPLRYDTVYRLKADFPELEIVLNGGVETLDAAEAHLAHVDGVMIGRAAYQNPYLLAGVDRRFFGEAAPPPSREAVLKAMLPYLEAEVARGTPLARMTRHLFGLFTGMPGARAWRQHLTEHAARPGGTFNNRTALNVNLFRF